MSGVKQLFPILFFISIFTRFDGHAQCALGGSVSDSLGNGQAFVTIALFRADSQLYKGELTNGQGEFCFSNISKGRYYLSISTIGFSNYQSALFEYDSLSPLTLAPILLHNQGIDLDEIAVSTIKQPIEFKGGNITVNVEGSPLALGNSVFDLIARLPGVMIEGNNISLQGKTGVRVYINDRIQQLSGQQLLILLKSMSASSVEKIEIINNPPARYDAAGSAGIINIRTRQIKITGFSGGVNYNYSQGFYSTNMAGFSLNYKGKSFSLFSNTSLHEGAWHNIVRQENFYTFNGSTSSLLQKSYENDAGRSASIDLGLDWYLTKKITLGFKVQATPGSAMRTLKGQSTASDNKLGYRQMLYKRPNYNYWQYYNFNFNAERKLDTAGKEKIKFSTDYYGPYYDIYKADYQYRFLGSNGADTLLPQIFRTFNYIALNILALRLDYEKTFKKDLRLEAGIKQSNQVSGNNYVLENLDHGSGDFMRDTIFSNTFRYHEQISAAYVSIDKKLSQLNVVAGLRAENTDIHTESSKSAFNYQRQYFNLFPQISTDYNPDKNHSFSLSYNRRISRPDYNSFNPFRSFNNKLNSSEGNPYLLPIYENIVSFNYVYRSSISNNITFTHAQNPIFRYNTQNDSTREVVNHTQNMKDMDFVRYSFFLRRDLKKWWVISFLAGGYYIQYNGIVNGQYFSLQKIPWYSRLTSIFTLPKNTKLEVTGFYWSPWLGNTSVFQQRMGLSLAIKRSLVDDKLNISIAMNDVFFTETFSQSAKFQNQDWSLFESFDSRRLNISLSYNFGKIKVEQRSIKENEEEKRRLGK